MNFERTPGEEKVKLPEVPADFKTLLLIQRHGKYDSGRPADMKAITPEEEQTLGRLTQEGIDAAKARADARLEAVLSDAPEKADFLVINSPTFWLDQENLGQRARETAEVIAGELQRFIDEGKISKEQVLNNLTRDDETPAFKDGASRQEERLGEALMFQVPAFANFLRKEYGGQGPKFWSAFNKDTHKELREELGAEGPAEIAERMREFTSVLARFGSMYHKQHEGRKLVIWVVTHGDTLEPYENLVLGAPHEDIHVGYNDGIGIAIDGEGEAVSEVGGKSYAVDFPKHGKK